MRREEAQQRALAQRRGQAEVGLLSGPEAGGDLAYNLLLRGAVRCTLYTLHIIHYTLYIIHYTLYIKHQCSTPPPVAHLLQPLQDLADQVLVAPEQREGVQDEVLLLCNDGNSETQPPVSTLNTRHLRFKRRVVKISQSQTLAPATQFHVS